jgi:hypothetical protein
MTAASVAAASVQFTNGKCGELQLELQVLACRAEQQLHVFFRWRNYPFQPFAARADDPDPTL